VQKEMQGAGTRRRDTRHAGKDAGLDRREHPKVDGEEYHEKYSSQLLFLLSNLQCIRRPVKDHYPHFEQGKYPDNQGLHRINGKSFYRTPAPECHAQYRQQVGQNWKNIRAAEGAEEAGDLSYKL
jgi:hypothetical protein